MPPQKTFRRMIGFLKVRLTQLGLRDLPDPRDPRGKRWTLEQVLTVCLLGLMAGCKNLSEVESLTAGLSRGVRRALGISRRVPDTTVRDVLCRLNHEDLVPLLHQLVRQLRAGRSLETDFPIHVAALDGRGTALTSWEGEYAQRHNHDSGAVYGLMRTVTATLVTSPARPCIDVSPIPAATNEMGHFQTALEQLCHAHGRLVTMITYDQGANGEDNALAVLACKKHYFFRMNDERRGMQQLAAELLEHVGVMASDREARSNRTEVLRTVRLMPINHTTMPSLPRKSVIWNHARTLVRVDSQTLVDGETESELTRYFCSSLPTDRLTPEQWLWITKAHWGVETNHQILDQSFEEDKRPWIRNDPNGMLAVLVLRRIAYTLLTMFRSVTLRSEANREMPWKRLFAWVRDTLVASTEATVSSIRKRTIRLAAI